MRLLNLLAPAALAAVAAPAAACGVDPGSCPGVVFPLFTPEGLRVGTVRAEVEPPLSLATSPFTGQPVTVVYGTPGRPPAWVGPPR